MKDGIRSQKYGTRVITKDGRWERAGSDDEGGIVGIEGTEVGVGAEVGWDLCY